ncbi:tumor necrosis factor receptor superfamily member 9-like [Rhinoraja longicauda]
MEQRALALLMAMIGAVSAQHLCDKGTFRDSRTGQCTPCPATSYTSTPNNQSHCNRCRMCSVGKFQTRFQCLAFADTVCGCQDGFMCTRHNCKSCKAHTTCKRGQQVEREGDSFKDRQCQDCQSGTFSNQDNGICKPWTDCSAKGLRVARNGSSTEDVTCAAPLASPVAATSSNWSKHRTPTHHDQPRSQDKYNGIAVIIAIVLVPCVSIPFALYVVMQTKRAQKKPVELAVKNNEDVPFALVVPVDNRCSWHCPEEEMGDWQLRQETAPKRPE